MILVVEDEVNIRKLIKIFLQKEGYQIYEGRDGVEGFELLRQKKISLIITDLNMPNKDGFSMIKDIREISNIPIIILSAHDSIENQIKSYDLGAHAFLPKPFKGPLLVSLVKRFYPIDQVIIVGDLYLDKKKAIIKHNESVIDLSPREYDLLLYFVENQNILLSRDKLLDAVWGIDFCGTDRVVDNHIKKLRKKLGESRSYIETVISKGYKFGVNDEVKK